jgi:hypothetical protein
MPGPFRVGWLQPELFWSFSDLLSRRRIGARSSPEFGKIWGAAKAAGHECYFSFFAKWPFLCFRSNISSSISTTTFSFLLRMASQTSGSNFAGSCRGSSRSSLSRPTMYQIYKPFFRRCLSFKISWSVCAGQCSIS